MNQVLQKLNVYDTRRNHSNARQGDMEEGTRVRPQRELPTSREQVGSCSSASVSDTVIGDVEESSSSGLESNRRQTHMDTSKESRPIDHKKQSVSDKSPHQKHASKTRWLPILSILAVAGLIASRVFWITTRQEEKMTQMRVRLAGTCTLASFSILSRKLTEPSSMSLVYSRLFHSLKVQLLKHWMF